MMDTISDVPPALAPGFDQPVFDSIKVFRVVAETDYANHAGQSVWADEKNIYWGLNQSFLGVAFEAQTDAPDGASSDIV